MDREFSQDEENVITEPESEMNELLSWEFLERPDYERGPVWHALAILSGLGLLIYAVYSANFLFALIVIMFGLVIYATLATKPRPRRFAITEEGIEVGGEFYRFREIRRFWFFYEPPIRSLYVHLKGVGMSSRMRIDLGEQDPNEVRRILGQFVKEDLKEEDEPISDTISRIIKI